jgi:acyl transferase domain-containing protein/NAD(P)-dependent dehydrogenase (short-subunit alcohol dehydrogenase family)/acyl carrier protein
MAPNHKYNGLEVAIIGLSAQFPDCRDHRQFWENLQQGKEFIRTLSDEELRSAGVPEADFRNELFVRRASVLAGKGLFDHNFFGYTADEAGLMDPQTRLLHEHCWMALEDAGYASLVEKHKIGLFAGASTSDPWKVYAFTRPAVASIDPFYLKMIASSNFISTLVAYKLNLRGPAYFVDTACSTSLAAVHLACRSLLTRDCGIALAGGVSVNTGKRKGYFYREGMIQSKDGHCRSFDKDSSGTLSGEGVGVVVLKRLSEALNDGDHIYAVIKATAANNDGSYKVGYTAPSVKGQTECIMAAHKLAGIDPRSISFVEAHGTATKLGDPIEIRALNEAFATGGSDKFCAVGSVKSNMGHLDVTAGVAGLIKATLSLNHAQIPPSLHYTAPNPEVDFDGGPFFINTTLKEWPSKPAHPRRAGVSSLGIGGTNVHAVLEEAPPRQKDDVGRSLQLLPLSAKTPDSLARYMRKLHDFLDHEPFVSLADMAYTLQVGRKSFPYRKAIAYNNREELLKLLESAETARPPERTQDRGHTVAFLFPGQGSQYPQMCRGLYEQEPLFRQQLDLGLALIMQLTGEDFKEILFTAEDSDSRINDTRYAQPLIFLVEYALAQLVMGLGITPHCMIGHSIGEYTAACISGVFSFEDALRLVIRRGALMGSLPAGTMLSAAISEEQAVAYINERVSLAAVNSPGQVVFSGAHEPMKGLMRRLDSEDIAYTKLHTSHAFHSYMQEPVLESFEAELRTVKFHKPAIRFISNLTGELITDEEAANPAYWVRHLRNTVRFSHGVQTLLSGTNPLVCIEVGAGHSLSSLVRQREEDHAAACVSMVRGVRQQHEDAIHYAAAIGELWSLGLPVDWSAYYQEERRNRVSLPAYCFEPVQHPAEVDPYAGMALTQRGTSGHELRDWIYFPGWKRSIGAVPEAGKEESSGCLLFSAGAPFFGSLKSELLRNRTPVVEVKAGERYTRESEGQYVINPFSAADFRQLFQELESGGFNISHIAYCWGADTAGSSGIPEAGSRELQLAWFSLAGIVQSIMQSENGRELRVALVTAGLHRVTGAEQPGFVQSLLLGFLSALPQECAIGCFNVDIEPGNGNAGLAARVAREIMGNKGGEERIVAYRNGQRWVQDYERNQRPVKGTASVIRQGGLYLITGGLGNVGLVLSRHLLKTHGVRLVLTGRRMAGEVTDRLAYLQNLGEVHYRSVDVSELEALRTVVEEIERDMGPVNGVVHTAGLIDPAYFELVEDMTEDKVLAMLKPKVTGVENLHNALRGSKPDFVWLTSSIATVLGGLGYGAYSAANLYMDHFASARRAEGANWVAVGLAEMSFDENDLRRPNSITSSEIAQLFEWSLSLNESAVILETVEDLPSRIRKSYEVKRQQEEESPKIKETALRSGRPDLSTTYVAAETGTQARLQEMFDSFFNMEDIGIDDGFFELGGDSLKAMILLKRIKNEFSINFTLLDFLSRATIRAIAAKVDELLWLKSEVEMENEITI